MAIVRAFKEEYSYVLKCDRNLSEEEQTTWWYKAPSLSAQYDDSEEFIFKGDITDKGKADNVTTKFKPSNTIKNQAKVIKSCLVRVGNLKNDKGDLVEWPINSRSKDNTKLQEDFISVLPREWRSELVSEFLGNNQINEEEEKN